ncbi:hypothetical protein PTSG_12884 [Salpingoeca rosetta]|uniref:Copper homeostasis protein cutC homolog n=1 Tax=Salpingoeca rosetta (strain ATCC 50818 / BSB-021) TaxID=946362 RepID=F2UMN0_SALR5|nr:uncharacterized protein PTSG_12884 [Salpingoeca rosetta]EGD78379.1 hypothetical protein PTSG_12884 [Salpingoeca rosetta]|eukprot:XP_004989702.1 hypothetical protein PTSG_12884 [Salpingoeca rosetta]
MEVNKLEDGSLARALSWDELRTLIEEQRVEVLGRSTPELARYRAWRKALTKCYKSPTDHLANVVFGYPVHADAETGLFEVVVPDPAKRRRRYILRDNDFPYNVEDGIRHSVLWAESGDLTDAIIQEQLATLLLGCPYLYFINPPALQSVPRFKHCHVFWKERTQHNPLVLEVCVDSVASAAQAQQGGADRLELCCALSEGGLTPTVGLAKAVVCAVSIPVFALVRPRAGDFLFSEAEVQIMVDDIEALRACGIQGFVIGALNADGDVDTAAMKKLLAACGPLPVTFHRAFDMVRDMRAALATLGTAFGANRVQRVLTSGGRATALEGAPVICSLAATAREHGITLMAGGGVSEHNAQRIASEAGVVEVHCSARASVDSAMGFRNTAVHMGAGLFPPEFSHKRASAPRVQAIKHALSAAE